MKRIDLQKIIREEVKSVLEFTQPVSNTEAPSEAVIKGVQKELKLKTGIISMLGLTKTTRNGFYYTYDLSKEIRTPVLNSLFSSMTLDITAVPSAQIGGYTFSVSINYTHPDGGSNGKNIGTIFYINNVFKSRF